MDTKEKQQEEYEICCDKFVKNWAIIHLGCEMAARNGTPISVVKIKYCPWCGKEFKYKIYG